MRHIAMNIMHKLSTGVYGTILIAWMVTCCVLYWSSIFQHQHFTHQQLSSLANGLAQQISKNEQFKPIIEPMIENAQIEYAYVFNSAREAMYVYPKGHQKSSEIKMTKFLDDQNQVLVKKFGQNESEITIILKSKGANINLFNFEQISIFAGLLFFYLVVGKWGMSKVLKLRLNDQPPIDGFESKTQEKNVDKICQKLDQKKKKLIESQRLIEEQNKLLTEQKTALELLVNLVNFSQQELKDSREILNQYIKEVCKFAQWPVGHIYFVGEGEEHPLVSSDIWYTEDDEKFKPFVQLTKKLTLSEQKKICGQVLESNRPIWLNDPFSQENTHFAKLARQLELLGSFTLPLYRYGKVFAIAQFYSFKGDEVNYSFFDFATTAAKHVSLILERRLSEKKLKMKNATLENTLTELKKTQGQLLQSSKMASIGQLAAGVAHEINNPIGFVLNNVSILRKYLKVFNEVISQYQRFVENANQWEKDKYFEEKGKIEHYLKSKKTDFIFEDSDNLIDESLDGMKRVVDIVAGLKSFSRVDQAETKYACINHCLESTLKVVWNELKYKCQIETDFSEIPEIKCNPGKLNQVFMNLIVNAGQSIENKGKISIKTFLENSEILVKIKDTGQGIPQENLEKLFDPFFTTKPVGVGTGLGLSISYGIIQEHKGCIEVDSLMGQGTTFTIRLPVVERTV